MHHTFPTVVGGLIITGGIAMFLRFKSKHSFLVGTSLGCGLVGGGVLLSQGYVAGHYLAIGSGSLLAISTIWTVTSTLVKVTAIGVGSAIIVYHTHKLLNQNNNLTTIQ